MGLQYTYPTSTVNNMTFTARRWGYFPSISYVAGGTAGSEIVSTDASHNISVKIQSGVSTNTQIKSAIDATTPSGNGMGAGDYVSVAIASGHGSDTNVPGVSSVMTGAIAPDYLGYYCDNLITPLTSGFQLFKFPFFVKFVLLANLEESGTNGFIYSWDGINNHGIMRPGQSTMLDKVNVSMIFLKYLNGAPAYKISARTNS